MQEVRVYSHDGPIIRRRRGYILTRDLSDAGSAGIFARWTNQPPCPRPPALFGVHTVMILGR
eukprot:6577512-Pyramimonas_sp.AAC.2